MNNYILHLQSDNGPVRIRTAAKDETIARQIVCNAELCPDSAIKAIYDLQFYNGDGSLNKYGFACGYIERQVTADRWKELYFESNTFHVRTGPVNSKFTKWENFDPSELTKARKLYKSL